MNDDDDVAHAHHTHPFTSHEAAESLDSDVIRASQEAVLRELRRVGPCIDIDLVQAYLDGPEMAERPQSVSGIRTRRKEVVRKGRAEWTGETQPTPSGRNAKVWRVCDGPPQSEPTTPPSDHWSESPALIAARERLHKKYGRS